MSVQLLLAQLYLYYNQLSPTKTRKTGKKNLFPGNTSPPQKNRKTGKKKTYFLATPHQRALSI